MSRFQLVLPAVITARGPFQTQRIIVIHFCPYMNMDDDEAMKAGVRGDIIIRGSRQLLMWELELHAHNPLGKERCFCVKT